MTQMSPDRRAGLLSHDMHRTLCSQLDDLDHQDYHHHHDHHHHDADYVIIAGIPSHDMHRALCSSNNHQYLDDDDGDHHHDAGDYDHSGDCDDDHVGTFYESSQITNGT